MKKNKRKSKKTSLATLRHRGKKKKIINTRKTNPIRVGQQSKNPIAKPTTFETYLPDGEGIKAVTVNFKIDKSVPTPVVSFPLLTKSDWPDWVKDAFIPQLPTTDSDLTRALMKRFVDVFGAL